MNNTLLVGRIGKEIELKTSKNDKKYCTFSLATNDGFGDNKKTNWHNCIAYGKTSEIIHKYVNKGDNLAISGSIDYSSKDDKYYTNIIVNNFTLLGTKNSDNSPLSQNNTQTKPQSQEALPDDDLPF